MTKSKKILFSIFSLGIVATLAVPAMAVSCQKDQDKPNNGGSTTGGSTTGGSTTGGSTTGGSTTGGTVTKDVTIKVQSYADQMIKLASKDINLAGAWGDARFYAGKYSGTIVAVGATDVISNDGVQVRPTLKQGDIEALQNILMDLNKKSHAKNNPILQIEFGKNNDGTPKMKSVFEVYSHAGYSVVNPDDQIRYNTNGDTKQAYGTSAPEGSDYFTKNSDGSYTFKGNKSLKIQFIPSADTALLQRATFALQKYLNDVLDIKAEISTSVDYNTSAKALDAGSIDVSFLPVDAWASQGPKTNFILQAGRGVQIADPYKSATKNHLPAIEDEKILVDAINEYKKFNESAGKGALYVSNDASKNPQATAEGYPQVLKDAVDNLTKDAPASLPVVRYYRSYIFAVKGSEIEQLITKALNEQGTNWKLNWADVQDKIKYGFIQTTSSASYTYPEAWFKKHFTGFTTFK